MPPALLGPLVAQIQQLSVRPAATSSTDGQLLDNFRVGRDPAAFAALVGRHGPLVLRVCRRVLRHEQDAEDAFQATFLILARKVGSIHKRESLASWLHGVAYRTAQQAKRAAARRRNRETQARLAAPVEAPGPSWDDVQAVLDEEVQNLAEPYRRAFVLCVLQGRSVPKAAAEMGCKPGTASSRLARARHTLRQRLERRGIKLSALLAALSVAESTTKAAVPAALVGVTSEFGLLVAAGEPAAGMIPPHVAALAAGVTRAMFLSKAKSTTTILLALSFVALGAGVWAHPTQAVPRQESAAKRPAERNASLVEVRGRVLDPDGKPVLGARLIFLYPSPERAPEKVWATSSADGRFQFSAPVAIEANALPRRAWDSTYVVAAAEGHGFAWARVSPETANGVTLQLVKDDVPIRGRILDLEGRPVAGVTVRVDNELYVPKAGDLTAWLAKLDAGKADPDRTGMADFTTLFSGALATLFPPVKTGPDGRFRINGVGRERVAALHVQGPTIATGQMKALTREVKSARSASTYHGATFDLVAAPTKPVVGVVRDKDTGKPLAGVTVRSHKIGGVADLNGLVRATTDNEGRYRLVGLPKRQGNSIAAEGQSLPYLRSIRRIADTPGFDPVKVDLSLKRGVWIEGRVLDKATGKPVRAGLEYFAFEDNPHAADLTFGLGTPEHWTRADGSFRFVGVPGRGVVAARARQDVYLMGIGADRIKGPRVNKEFLSTLPSLLYPGNYHTLVEVSPKPGDESASCEVYLDPGRALQGTVVGPDGKPLAGARASGLRPMNYWEDTPQPRAEFTLWGLSPDKARLLRLVHDEKKLAGWLEVPGDETKPVRVRLEPWGVILGRVVTPAGKAMTDVSVYVGGRSARPDKDGRFRFEGLAPGLKYQVSVTKEPGYSLEITSDNAKGLTVKSGETKELGDVRVKPME